MSSTIKEIIKIILYLKGIDMLTVSKNISVSYTSLRKYLIYNSKMTVLHVIEIFDYLQVPYTKAVIWANSNMSRLDLIESILKEVKNNE